MNTVEERKQMIPIAEKAGYHITYIVCLIEDMTDFAKANKRKPMSDKLLFLDSCRWLNTESFKSNNKHLSWLELIDSWKD